MKLLPPLIVVILILIVAPSQKFLACYTKCLETPTLAHLILPSRSISKNALIKAREEKLRIQASIRRKLDDGWDPMIKIKLNNFSCYALCDVGASTSVMPKRMYDMFELEPFDSCSFG